MGSYDLMALRSMKWLDMVTACIANTDWEEKLPSQLKCPCSLYKAFTRTKWNCSIPNLL